jgi:hypothetical protein
MSATHSPSQAHTAADYIEASLERGERFKAELKTCPPEMRTQLIGAWKESILETLVEVFRVSDDPNCLHAIDVNIAIARAWAAGTDQIYPDDVLDDLRDRISQAQE